MIRKKRFQNWKIKGKKKYILLQLENGKTRRKSKGGYIDMRIGSQNHFDRKVLYINLYRKLSYVFL